MRATEALGVEEAPAMAAALDSAATQDVLSCQQLHLCSSIVVSARQTQLEAMRRTQL